MTEFVTVFDDSTEACARRALPKVLPGAGISVEVSVDSFTGSLQYTVDNIVTASVTDLSYNPSPVNGIVVSSDGADAVIPLANITNAGLLRPISGDASDVLLGNGTFGDVPLPPIVTTSSAGLIPTLSGNVNQVFLGNGTYGPAPAHVKFAVADEGSNLGTTGTVTKIDFIGAGVAASRVGNTVTVNVPGGGGGGGGLPTNLTYTASPTNGTVLSDTGNDATIPLADDTNAGLLGPLSGDINDVLLGDGTFGPAPGQVDIQFVDHGTNLGTSGTVNSFNVTGGGVTFTRSANTVTLNVPSPTPVTNLAYTPSPTNGVVVSSTGVDAIIPLANSVNAGLMVPTTGVATQYLSGTGQFANLPVATTGIVGMVELATNSEVNTGVPGKVVTADQLRNELEEIAPCTSAAASAAIVNAMTVDPSTLRLTVCFDDGNTSTVGITGDQLKAIIGGNTSSVDTLIPANDNEWNITNGNLTLQCVVPGEYIILVKSQDNGSTIDPEYIHGTRVIAAAGDRVSPLTSNNQVNVRYLLAGQTVQHYSLNQNFSDSGIQGRFPPGSTEYTNPYVAGNQVQPFGSGIVNVTSQTYYYNASGQNYTATISIYKIA